MTEADSEPRRVELMFPVEHAAHKASVRHAIRSMFRDNVKARVLGSDGTYSRRVRPPADPVFRVQVALLEEAHQRAAQAVDRAGVTFRPVGGAHRT